MGWSDFANSLGWHQDSKVYTKLDQTMDEKNIYNFEETTFELATIFNEMFWNIWHFETTAF